MKKHVLLTAMAAILISITALSQKSQLSVKGNLLDPLKDFDKVELNVTVNESETHLVELSKKGEFKIKIYNDEQYTLRFSREGWIEKVIEIDTSTPEGLKLVGTIEFNVFMERQGRLKDDSRLCASYYYSEEESTLIYTIPEVEEHFLAFTN